MPRVRATEAFQLRRIACCQRRNSLAVSPLNVNDTSLLRHQFPGACRKRSNPITLFAQEKKKKTLTPMWQPKNLFRVAQYTQLVRSPGIISWVIITRYRVNNRSAYISNNLFTSGSSHMRKCAGTCRKERHNPQNCRNRRYLCFVFLLLHAVVNHIRIDYFSLFILHEVKYKRVVTKAP